jgi:hypothetical protein
MNTSTSTATNTMLEAPNMPMRRVRIMNTSIPEEPY